MKLFVSVIWLFLIKPIASPSRCVLGEGEWGISKTEMARKQDRRQTLSIKNKGGTSCLTLQKFKKKYDR